MTSLRNAKDGHIFDQVSDIKTPDRGSNHVSVNWLADHFDRVQIVSCPWGAAVTPDQKNDPTYQSKTVLDRHNGGIPGSIFLNLDEFGFPCEYDPSDLIPAFAQYAHDKGISPKTPVIVDDLQAGGSTAGLFWWLLTEAGHRSVYVLDGGFYEWQKENPSVKGSVISCVEKAQLNIPPTQRIATMDDIKRHMNDTQLVSIRHKSDFEASGGDIPGSINIPFYDFVDEDRCFGNHILKEREELNAVFKKAGLNLNKAITAYCEIGVMTPQFVLAAERVAGRRLEKLKCYPGSWAQWCEYNQ